jgi:NAD(P)-dependent dehydrogenase (short-subunit alcohol dehydrogenase family)
MERSALIVGAGSGVSGSFARVLASQGYRVALASRQAAARTPELPGALRIPCDASDPSDVARLFARLDAEMPPLAVVLYNPSFRSRGPLVDLVADDVQRALQVTAFGAFLVAQQAARRMLARGSGTLVFTGASASVKGYAQSAPFAMGKFALRGLAQSIARELAPQNIHVAHVVIDGAVRGSGYPETTPDSQLDPEAIAQSMWQLVQQPRTAWSWEIELRPWVEKF